MQELCFQGHYGKRISRVKEFCQDKVEVVLDEFLKRFCDIWLAEEYTLQSGRERYQRGCAGTDYRGGHYRRMIVTGRGVIEVRVPRGERGRYRYSLFERYQRRTKDFEAIVADALIKGHSSRKASRFFANVFGRETISHQAAVGTLRRFDKELEYWKQRPIRDEAMILVLDAVALKGSIRHSRTAKPVLFAYAVYPDGTEEVLDFEIAPGESTNAWVRFCQRLYERGLREVRLVVHDDTDAISNAIALCWPKALDQQCIFHIMQNVQKKLKGWENKKDIVKDLSWLYEAVSEEEFYRWLIQFERKYKKYRNTKPFKYFFSKVYQSIQYFALPREYWTIAKTSNRLERFFEELKRRIKVFRRFPNSQSCNRWLYALITEVKPGNNSDTNFAESQQYS